MTREFIKNWVVVIGTGLTFAGFVLDILDIRQWWDRVIVSLFQFVGIQPAPQNAVFQIFFWLSFAFSLTLLGIAVILLGSFLKFLFTGFELRAFSLDIDFGDISGSTVVRQVGYGVIWSTVIALMFILMIGEYPSWDVIKLFLVIGLPIGVFVSLFMGAIGGVFGYAFKNLAYALFGIGLGTVLSIAYWDGLNFAPRIAVLGLLGSLVGLPDARVKVGWALIILLMIFAFLISLLGGIP